MSLPRQPHALFTLQLSCTKALILFLFFSLPLQAFWTHLELGAGNYGRERRHSPRFEDHYETIFDLPENEKYHPTEQYTLLYWTLDQLVERYGEEGVFHVNDNQREYAEFCAEMLQDYAIRSGYTKIHVQALVKDFRYIEAKESLQEYQRSRYDTIHLKNPETSFFQSREGTRKMLQNIANQSETGLFFFVLYHPTFFPEEEKREYVNKGLFYQSTEEWPQLPYFNPSGALINKLFQGRTFHIKRES